MSRFVQAQFAKHPIVGSGLVFFRWLVWSLVGHPAGTFTAMLIVVVGGRFDAGIAVAVAAMAFISVEGVALDRGPVWYRSWSLGCRFARCWPSLWSAIVKDAAKVTGKDSGVAVARLVCSCPWISMVPKVSGTSVVWKVRTQKGLTLKPLTDATEAIAASSNRIHDVDVLYSRATASRAEMVVQFGDVLENVEAPAWA